MKVFKLCVGSFLLAAVLTYLFDIGSDGGVDHINHIDKEKYDDEFADKLFQIDLSDDS